MADKQSTSNHSPVSSLLCYLLTLNLSGIFGYLCTVLLLLAATMCKEQGITISAVCLLYDLFIVQQVRSTCTLVSLNAWVTAGLSNRWPQGRMWPPAYFIV